MEVSHFFLAQSPEGSLRLVYHTGYTAQTQILFHLH